MSSNRNLFVWQRQTHFTSLNAAVFVYYTGVPLWTPVLPAQDTGSILYLEDTR